MSTKTNKIFTLAAVELLLFSVAASGLSMSAGNPFAVRAAFASSSSVQQVNIADDSFSPSVISISVGDSIIWNNTGSLVHSVTASDGSFDSGDVPAGSAYQRTFTAPGIYGYYCKYHGSFFDGMKGIVLVQTAAQNPSPPPGSGSDIGTRFINDAGTFYLILGSVRHGITGPGILASYGLTFAQAATATALDQALPLGEILAPNDGALVKTAADPTVWLISSGERHGFSSASVFAQLGFSFSQVLTVTSPELLKLPVGEIISDGLSRHLPGLDINSSGTIYWVDNSSVLHPYASAAVYNSWHLANDFSTVVPANSADLNFSVGDPVQARVLQ